jgi:hypothetical protein
MPNPMIPAIGEALTAVDLLDELSAVNAMIEAAHMAAGRLSKEYGDAIQSVLDIAQDKLKAVRGAIRGREREQEPPHGLLKDVQAFLDDEIVSAFSETEGGGPFAATARALSDRITAVVGKLVDSVEPLQGGRASEEIAARYHFEQLYSTWLRARSAEIDPSRDVNDNDLQNALTNKVEEAARLLLSTPVPLDWMIRWKWEILEGWADGGTSWTDNRVGFTLGCIKADMQRFINWDVGELVGATS